MLGIFMQRAMLVVSIASIPVSVIWAYVGHILRALGQDPEIASTAQLYAQWMIPSLFAYGFLQCQLKFLQTQNIVISLMVSSGITAVVHPFICWFLVFKTHMGSKGAALANGLSYWINVLILALYIRFSPSCKNSWTGFSREAFGGLLSFLRLAVPSAVMVWYNFICSFGDCSFYCLIFLRVLPAECSYGTSTSFRIIVGYLCTALCRLLQLGILVI